MRTRTSTFALAVVLVLAAATAAVASDGQIRLQFQPDVCQSVIPCGETRTLYVYAALEGATANGITGVEYSLRLGPDGAADPGWIFVETFVPGALAVGQGACYPPDQLAITPRVNIGRGINVAWPTCQRGSDDDDLLLIETIEVTNSGCGSGELRLLVDRHDIPRNSFFRCPLAVLCNGPVYTKVCLGNNVTACTNPEGPQGDPAFCSTSGEAVINPLANSESPCRVTPVQPSTWTQVKGLYRN